MAEFTPAEAVILAGARALWSSSGLHSLRRSHRRGDVLEVRVGDVTVVYQPDLPPDISAMTLFGEGGFVLGPAAFRSDMELWRTILQEMFRLGMGQAASGMTADQIRAQTQDAFAFAERASKAL